MKQLTIILAIFLVAAFIFWAWPKSHTLTVSDYFVGHYRGFGIPGFENPVLGKRYYLVTINLPGVGYFKVKLRCPGYNDFKRFYPNGTLAEEGQCLVEYCDSPEPLPDYHNLLWSKCYKPDGTLCSEVKNGTGTQIYGPPMASRPGNSNFLTSKESTFRCGTKTANSMSLMITLMTSLMGLLFHIIHPAQRKQRVLTQKETEQVNGKDTIKMAASVK